MHAAQQRLNSPSHRSNDELEQTGRLANVFGRVLHSPCKLVSQNPLFVHRLVELRHECGENPLSCDGTIQWPAQVPLE